MLHFPANQLSAKQQYKFLSGSIIPRPIAWITTLNRSNQVVNAAPFSFFSVAAADIPLVTISILRKDGTLKDTARNILETQELVIHLVDTALAEKMNATAASLPPEQSEILLNSIATISSHSVSTPAIKEAKIRMEAQLYQHVPIFNQEQQPISDLFIVEIKDFYFDPTVFDRENDYILLENFHAVARLAGNQYAEIGSTFELKRPQ